MVQSSAAATTSGPQPGDLIADFSGHAADGRAVWRRDFKGRRHLVLCFAAPLPDHVRRDLLAELTTRLPAFRAAGAEVVAFWPGDPPAEPATILADPDGRTHARYSATAPLLIAADRYGEIVLRRPLDNLPAALDEALAAIEWMQTRCSV
jgi:hypothetical protein